MASFYVFPGVLTLMFWDSPNFECLVPMRSSHISNYMLSFCVQTVWSQLLASLTRVNQPDCIRGSRQIIPLRLNGVFKETGFASTGFEGSELQ